MLKESFYDDGTLRTVERYWEGRLHGEVVLYWPNGALKRKCAFLNGVREGLDQMWSETGQLLDEGSYRLGKPIGIHRRFHKNGTLLEEHLYE